MEIREAESACVCVGRVRVRVCLSGKREGEISARKLSLNKCKILCVIFTASNVSPSLQATCHHPCKQHINHYTLLNHCMQV